MAKKKPKFEPSIMARDFDAWAWRNKANGRWGQVMRYDITPQERRKWERRERGWKLVRVRLEVV